MPTVNKGVLLTSWWIILNRALSFPIAPSVAKKTCLRWVPGAGERNAACKAGNISLPPPADKFFKHCIACCTCWRFAGVEVWNNWLKVLLNSIILNRSWGRRSRMAICKLSFAWAIERPGIEPEVSMTKIISRASYLGIRSFVRRQHHDKQIVLGIISFSENGSQGRATRYCLPAQNKITIHVGAAIAQADVMLLVLVPDEDVVIGTWDVLEWEAGIKPFVNIDVILFVCILGINKWWIDQGGIFYKLACWLPTMTWCLLSVRLSCARNDSWHVRWRW